MTNQSHFTTQTTFIQSILGKGVDEFIFQMFDDGYRINITSLTDNNISIKDLNPFQNQYKQKQVRITESLAASAALLNDTDIHSDDDDIIDEGIPARGEMNYIEPQLKKSTDYQSEYKMPNILSQTNLSIVSLE